MLLPWIVACFADETAKTAAPGRIVSIGEIDTVTVRAGEPTTVTVPVVVADGYHVQSNPAANEFLVPLELTFGRVDGLVFGIPEYPPPHRHRLHGAEEDLLTYEGTVVIEIPLAVRGGEPGVRTVTGDLRYQACDSRRCLFPASIPVELTVVQASPPI